jgi:hypothetical protein
LWEPLTFRPGALPERFGGLATTSAQHLADLPDIGF